MPTSVPSPAVETSTAMPPPRNFYAPSPRPMWGAALIVFVVLSLLWLGLWGLISLSAMIFPV